MAKRLKLTEKLEKAKWCQLFRCSRGPHFPNPEDEVLVCSNGHYTCGGCVKEGENVEGLNKCCTNTLQIYTGELLKVEMANAAFSCLNEDKGCDRVLMGMAAFHKHMDNCAFSTIEVLEFKCWESQCRKNFTAGADLLKHYLEHHYLSLKNLTPGGSVVLPVNWASILRRRRCTVLKMNDRVYLFATEVYEGNVIMWVGELKDKTVSPEPNRPEVWYSLDLCPMQGVSNTKASSRFTGMVVDHVVRPYQLIETGVRKALTFYMEVDKFHRLYVGDTRNGKGFVVTITLNDSGIQWSQEDLELMEKEKNRMELSVLMTAMRLQRRE